VTRERRPYDPHGAGPPTPSDVTLVLWLLGIVVGAAFVGFLLADFCAPGGRHTHCSPGETLAWVRDGDGKWVATGLVLIAAGFGLYLRRR
jgi:hypothetical protein